MDKTHELYWEFPYQAKKPIQAKKWKPPQQPQREVNYEALCENCVFSFCPVQM